MGVQDLMRVFGINALATVAVCCLSVIACSRLLVTDPLVFFVRSGPFSAATFLVLAALTCGTVAARVVPANGSNVRSWWLIGTGLVAVLAAASLVSDRHILAASSYLALAALVPTLGALLATRGVEASFGAIPPGGASLLALATGVVGLAAYGIAFTFEHRGTARYLPFVSLSLVVPACAFAAELLRHRACPDRPFWGAQVSFLGLLVALGGLASL